MTSSLSLQKDMHGAVGRMVCWFSFLSGCKPEEQLNCDSKQNNMAICRIRDHQNKKIPN